MDGAETRESLAREAETCNVLGLISVWRRRRFEALLREIGAAVDTNQFLGVGFNVIEYVAEEFW